MKKDAVITVRIPLDTRRQVERRARREGRSLSQQVERFIADGLRRDLREAGSAESEPPAPLAGALRQHRPPSQRDFREVRTLLSAAVRSRVPRD
jgi:hypothetical protein